MKIIKRFYNSEHFNKILLLLSFIILIFIFLNKMNLLNFLENNIEILLQFLSVIIILLALIYNTYFSKKTLEQQIEIQRRNRKEEIFSKVIFENILIQYLNKLNELQGNLYYVIIILYHIRENSDDNILKRYLSELENKINLVPNFFNILPVLIEGEENKKNFYVEHELLMNKINLDVINLLKELIIEFKETNSLVGHRKEKLIDELILKINIFRSVVDVMINNMVEIIDYANEKELYGKNKILQDKHIQSIFIDSINNLKAKNNK